ncbi:NADPH:quinone reductase [Rhizophlyctis rosea]|uniref:Probable quinone oxidoreductase n=1 Tax=Rhizophlyctis rosea TaxID=64517 RepID=A0AAD5S335_9FUNG|nr:NADPH:quinone reductase [Rhizophlyctis rosea]
MPKAVQINKQGGVDVLEVVDLPVPKVSPGKILIKNHFIGTNFIDTYQRSGLYKVPLPYILGREASGVIEAVGEGVTDFAVGDRVGYLHGSTYATYTDADIAQVVKLPDTVSFEAGASLFLQGLTALSLIRVAYEIKKDDYVLIHAAAGGTGALLVQLAKHYGAHVIGTTSTEEKAATAQSHGADDVILYTKQDVVEEVKRITGGKGVHAVFDGIGKATFDVSLDSLRKLGYFLSFGNASGKIDDVDVFKLVPRAIRLSRPSLFELITGREEFEKYANELLDLYTSKKIDFQIHKIYPLENAGDAHVDIESGKTQGKLLLKV